ncbi:MAG: AMP-binding protein [Planctomycetia bacterium]|nr:AMP-binding protein [Planctomycetia bacterium]
MATPERDLPAQGAGEFGRKAHSLVEVFRARADSQPNEVAFTFLSALSGEEPPAAEHRTYGELDRQARAMAAHLRRFCDPGDRALLMYDAGLDYLAALAGCFYAGVVAVPVYPLEPLRVARMLPRLAAIVNDAQATLLLGTASDLGWAEAVLGQIPALRTLLPSDNADPRLAERWTAPPLDRATPAILQYTSGSTGAPKGVLVRHGNVLANMAQMEQAIDVDDAVACTWLPAYHDMGLIGGVLQCWYSGRRNVMLSPVAFFQRPLAWLQAVAAYRATTIAAPDFGYDLCTRKIKPEQRAGLDLGCLQLALSGSEPVRAATIDRFVEAFAPCGVRREIFTPCYGMAEATLLISAAERRTSPAVRLFDLEQLSQNKAVEVGPEAAHARALVGCGKSAAGQRLIIVDPRSRAVQAPRQVGEIWVAGDNVASEYWRKPEDSAATFRAYTAAGDGPFLRTGDLGFLDRDELFISGRLKDLIIVHGRNHHPQDLEQSVESSHAALRPWGGAAFAIEKDGREQVIVVQEVARPKTVDLDEVSLAVRRALLESHDLVVGGVVLVRPGTIPKTTSGKVQRHACRQLFLDGALDALHAWQAPARGPAAESYVAPRNAIESMLAAAWSEVLGVPRVGIFDDFFELGGHSLLATQLASRLSRRLGVELPLGELFDRPTIAALAELIEARRKAEEAADADLLAQLESLSDEQAQAMLDGGPRNGASRPRSHAANGDTRSTTAFPAVMEGSAHPVIHAAQH